MSYTDSTVVSYNNQINNNNDIISKCNLKINQITDDIEELKQLRSKVSAVDDAVDTANSNTSAKINGLPSVIVNPLSFLRLNCFQKIVDLLNGNESKKAKDSLTDALSKIDAKIAELENEIQTLNGDIKQCNSQNNTLAKKRNSYIETMEAKIAEEKKSTQNAQSTAVQSQGATSNGKKAAIGATSSTTSSKGTKKTSETKDAIEEMADNIKKGTSAFINYVTGFFGKK